VAENPISKKAQSFIAQYIRSVEQLEIFLTLAKEPRKPLSVSQIFKQIQSSENSIADGLRRFVEEGLAVAEENSRFRIPEKPTWLMEVAAELQSLYRERRVTIIEMIYTKPAGPIESFAEAFRIRKEP
jgi:predicted transcriptional regulator